MIWINLDHFISFCQHFNSYISCAKTLEQSLTILILLTQFLRKLNDNEIAFSLCACAPLPAPHKTHKIIMDNPGARTTRHFASSQVSRFMSDDTLNLTDIHDHNGDTLEKLGTTGIRK